MKTKKVIAAVLVLMMVSGFALAERSKLDIALLNLYASSHCEENFECKYDEDKDIMIMTVSVPEISKSEWIIYEKTKIDSAIEKLTNEVPIIHETINDQFPEEEIDTIFKVEIAGNYPVIVFMNGKNVSKILNLN